MSSATLPTDARVWICAGAGGVGKTTISAALALGIAARGSKVAVITIDPAQRLAESLGLRQLGNEPVRVPLDRLGDCAAPEGSRAGGELWAMSLDAQRTLDELVELLLPDAQARGALFANRIYRELSSAVAGTQELTAVAKLYELSGSGDYDAIVLDTPPSRSALDFLDAPDRLTQFLESRTLTAMMRSAGLGARVLGSGPAAALRLLTRVTGVELLEDAASFLAALGELRGGFRERAASVRELLREPTSAFVLATSAERDRLDETAFLTRRLRSAQMRLGGVVVNRVHHDELGDFDAGALERSLSAELGASLAQRVTENLCEYHEQVEQDRAGELRLTRALGLDALIEIPQLDIDLHDLDGLTRVARLLLADARERARLIGDVVS